MEDYREVVAHHLDKMPGDTFGAGVRVWRRWCRARESWAAAHGLGSADLARLHEVMGPVAGPDWAWIAEEFGAPWPVPPEGPDSWILQYRYRDMPGREQVWPE